MGFAYIDRRSDESISRADRRETSALAVCSEAILRRQLAAGQHTLRIEDATDLAAIVGLPIRQVRPGFGDPTRRRGATA
jgi:hypothetical protein